MPGQDTGILSSYDVLVVGGGPAGLRAAECLSRDGWTTALAEHKPSVGRKFLVAGQGGLNLTHSEPLDDFAGRYGDDGERRRWPTLLADFSPAEVRSWAAGLGVETFVGTSARVFPTSKQAAPLLRRWVERLRHQGVTFLTRHRLTDFSPEARGGINVRFAPPCDGVVRAQALVLALGGASWPNTGSDGAWTELLARHGVEITPFQPANCGYEVAWPTDWLPRVEGLPLKNIVVGAGGQHVAGELLITRYGLEGGALYQLGRVLRAETSPVLTIDLKPTYSAEQLLARLLVNTEKTDLVRRASQAWRLSRAAQALLALALPEDITAQALAARAKALPLVLQGPRPIDEAISSAGGVAWADLDEGLMLRLAPGVFCAGEMIDWEAPTGGYLLQGCLATGTRAARGVADYLRRQGPVQA